MMKKLLKGLFVIPLLCPSITFACSCGGDGINSIKDAYSYYDHIFTTKFIEAKLVNSNNKSFKLSKNFAISPVERHIEIKHSIMETFKGNPNSVEKILGLVSGNSCGFPILIGKNYLLYVKGKNVFLSTCSRHRILGSQFPIEYILKVRNEMKWLKENADNKSK